MFCFRSSQFFAVMVLFSGCTTTVTRDFDFAKHREQNADNQCRAIVADIEGREYKTVTIGDQCWFAENLAVGKSRDGNVLDGTYVIDLERYGRLYTHDHVTVEPGLCPVGWHVPSDKEFQVLEKALGIASDDLNETGWRGGAFPALAAKKSATAFSWTKDQRERVNESGFSMLASGEHVGIITGVDGLYAGLWTTTTLEGEGWARYFVWNPLTGNNEKIWRHAVDKKRAYSVRCLRNSEE